MSNGSLPSSAPVSAGTRCRWLPVVAMVVVGVLYGLIALTAESELGATEARDAYYNLIVRGWFQGKVSLAMEAPAGLRALPNPYDPGANAPFRGQAYYGPRVHDLSYYQGKMYAYFSAVPAVVAFAPFRLVTGRWLSHAAACFGFCAVGYVAGALLLWRLRDRFFPRTGDPALAGALLGVGLVSVAPVLLERPDVWEVPITCAHAAWMITAWLAGVSLLRERPSWLPGLAAAVTAALAVGARPSTAFCALVLLPPFARLVLPGNVSWLRRCAILASFAAPFAAVGGGLLAFNHARFGNWREFGQKYQLNGEHDRRDSVRYFQASFLPYNARAYLVSTYALGREFPFIEQAGTPNIPWGHAGKDFPFGLLPHAPALLLALMLVPAWRKRSVPGDRPLWLLVGSLAGMVVVTAGPLLFFVGACARYQFEFTAPLALLAGLGFVAGESLTSGGWRRTGRIVGAALVAVSIGFSLCLAAKLRAGRLVIQARADIQRGNSARAIDHLGTALRLDPRLRAWRAERARLLATVSQFEASARDYARTIREMPEDAALYANYGQVLVRLARWDEAEKVAARALALEPGTAAVQALRAALDQRKAASPP